MKVEDLTGYVVVALIAVVAIAIVSRVGFLSSLVFGTGKPVVR